MNELDREIESLISRQFDGELTADEHQQLQSWINSDSSNAQAFVERSLMHDRLRIEAAQQEAASSEHRSVSRPESPQAAGRDRRLASKKSIRWAIGAIGSTAALLFVALLLFQVLDGSPALAAETQLERLIKAAKSSLDRTYLVTAIEGNKRKHDRRRDKQLAPSKFDRHQKKKPPVDGAILHIRGKDEYVLIRQFDNGDEFITGCDGKVSWSIAPRKGKVRISQDLNRFRGGMPGNQHSIPFINIHEDLENIRTAYDISWLDSGETSEANPELGCLVAEKKSFEHRGPKYIEIWFDKESGTIHELFLNKLGRYKPGPESILLELVDESPLPQDFFDHTTHHDSDREVIEE